MSSLTEKRREIRERARLIATANVPAPRLTSLGMHYLAGRDDSTVLVHVEVNVRRLLTMLGPRLRKSKRGVASAGGGAVTISVATAEGLEQLRLTAVDS